MIPQSIISYFENQKNVDIIPYPWNDFLKDKKDFYLFGYGSLICEHSTSKDLKNSKIMSLVNAYGIKRVLNYSPDKNVLKRYNLEYGEKYSAAFNVEYTKNHQNFANGVLRTIKESDFDSFIKREVGYSLVKVPCLLFNTETDNIIEAYTLCAPEFFNNRLLVNNELMPNIPYYNTCKQGALNVSEEFLNIWLSTSFIGNGQNVVEWENSEDFYK